MTALAFLGLGCLEALPVRTQLAWSG